MYLSETQLFFDKCRDSGLACTVVMVQGNLTVLTVEHLCLALLTGFLTGIFAVGASILGFFTFNKNIWLDAWVVGIFAMMADMLVHPTNFGSVFYAEGMLTGLVAAIITIVIGRIRKIL